MERGRHWEVILARGSKDMSSMVSGEEEGRREGRRSQERRRRDEERKDKSAAKKRKRARVESSESRDFGGGNQPFLPVALRCSIVCLLCVIVGMCVHPLSPSASLSACLPLIPHHNHSRPTATSSASSSLPSSFFIIALALSSSSISSPNHPQPLQSPLLPS